MEYSKLDKQILLDKISSLRGDYLEKTNKLFSSIKETGSILAGGWILGLYSGYESKDIDLYVHIKNAKDLNDDLESLGFVLNSTTIAPPYDQSFFRKNNILSRLYYKHSSYIVNELDVMIIPDNIPLENIVTNFDLTFCQTWFDGENVYTTNPEDVLNKKGKLRDEYLESLLVNFNKFIIGRIEKYRKRGFEISYDINREGRYTIERKKKKTLLPENDEQWVVFVLLKYITKSDILSEEEQTIGELPGLNIPIYALKKLERFTLEDLKKCLREINPSYLTPEGFKKFCLKALKSYHLWAFGTRTDSDEVSNKYFNIIERYLGITQGEFYDYIMEEDELDTELEEEQEYVLSSNIGQNININPVIGSIRSIDIDTNFDITFNIAYEDRKNFYKVLNYAYNQYKNFRFETFVYDENTLFLTDEQGNKIYKPCNDLYTFDNPSLIEFLEEENSILLINPGLSQNMDILCFTNEYIIQIIKDIYNNWFYDCNIDTGNSTTYVKIPINKDGLNGFISLYQLIRLLNNDSIIYYIIPQLENREQKMITKSATFLNKYSKYPYYVSANHCQDGSNILIYDLKICGGDKCVISNRS